MSDGFLSRWSQRKLAAKEGNLPETALDGQEIVGRLQSDSQRLAGLQPADPSAKSLANNAVASPIEDLPLPTEADLEQVRQGGDVKAFLSQKVSTDLKNKAFKALFSRPEFNQMDGLDIYIDDYSVFTPMTAEDIGKMSMSKQLLSRPDLEEKIQDLVALRSPDESNTADAGALDEHDLMPADSSTSVQCAGDDLPNAVHPSEKAPDETRVSPNEDSCGSSGVSSEK